MLTPSLISLFVTGLLLLLILTIMCYNINEIMSYRLYEKLVMLCLLSILIGIHGLIHLGVEKEYNYNPLKWFF